MPLSLAAKFLLLTAVLAYPVIRFRFTARATRAERNGDFERAQELRALGYKVMLRVVTIVLVFAALMFAATLYSRNY